MAPYTQCLLNEFVCMHLHFCRLFNVNLRRVAEEDILRNYSDELQLMLCSPTELLISVILFLIVVLIALH